MSVFKSIAIISVLGLGFGLSSPAFAQESAGSEEIREIQPTRQPWSFAGIFGDYDKGQLQRGFKVYHDVCSACHSMRLVAFRNLTDLGYTSDQIKTLAASYKIKDGPNEAGEMFERPGLPSDYFPWNFPNANAAVASLGALPPDMSLLAKARTYERGGAWFLLDPFIQYEEQGIDYIVALLAKGYETPPNGFKVPVGSHFNTVISGTNHLIAMANPLDQLFDAEGMPIDPNFYSDGTKMTREQVARDAAAFLMWAAEPHLGSRHRRGFVVVAFLLVFAAMLYFVKKRVWSNIH